MSEKLNTKTTQTENQNFLTKKDENLENEQINTNNINQQTQNNLTKENLTQTEEMLKETTQSENKNQEVENIAKQVTKQTSQTEENSTQAEENSTQTTQVLNIKKLSFWLGLLAVLIVGVQVVLNYFGIDFEVKIVIEVCSYLLALLLSVGVLKGSLKGKNIVETKENIEDALNSNIENVVNNTTKNKTDKTD